MPGGSAQRQFAEQLGLAALARHFAGFQAWQYGLGEECFEQWQLDLLGCVNELLHDASWISGE
ncbi:hypothetical protein D3C76_1703150 [compost metagenome]